MATIIAMPGNDIYMYTRHVYNVREIYFVGKDGEPINIPSLYEQYIDGKPASEYKAPEESKDKDKKKKKKDKKGDQNNSSTTVEPKIETRFNMEKLKELVDLDKSTAIIQNPHAATKAVYPGEKEEHKAYGTWITSLRDLLAHSGVFTAVIVNNHRHENDNGADVKAVQGVNGERAVENS